MRAKEACYHESCRRAYVKRDQDSILMPENESNNETNKDDAQTTAYCNAFKHICEHVEEHIIVDRCVEKMTMLHERYLAFIKEHTPSFYNSLHKTCRLKEKLIYFGERIQFWKPNYKSELVYSSSIVTGGSCRGCV